MNKCLKNPELWHSLQKKYQNDGGEKQKQDPEKHKKKILGERKSKASREEKSRQT